MVILVLSREVSSVNLIFKERDSADTESPRRKEVQTLDELNYLTTASSSREGPNMFSIIWLLDHWFELKRVLQ